MVLMRNYEPLSKIPWRDGWNASRSSQLPETSSPIPELQNACVFAPTTRTCRCGSPRTTRQQATAGCRPAGASGRVLSVGLRWSRGAGERYSKQWLCIAPVARGASLTLTVPHTRFDVLETLLERARLSKASCVTERSRRYSRKWATSARFAAMRRPTGARAQTTAGTRTSISSSSSWSRGSAAQLMDWRTRLYLRWDVYCQKAGLGSPSFQHGLDLRDGSFANNYVAKWGLEDEMTKGHIKKGKAGGKHLSTSCGQSWQTRTTSKRLRCLRSSPRLSRANGSCPGRMA